MYVTHDFWTVPLFRDAEPVDSEPEQPEPDPYLKLIHFASFFPSLPRLLRLGPTGDSHLTWFIYLLDDGSFFPTFDVVITPEHLDAYAEQWVSADEIMSYLGLLIMRYA